jgi:hypothetical protein
MDRSELEIIKELMAELEDKMQPGHEDFEERLGRQKPGVEMVKIEGKMPSEDPALEAKEEMMGKDLDGDMEMGEDPEHQEKVMGDDSDMSMPGEEMDPESKLKARLMKLRA